MGGRRRYEVETGRSDPPLASLILMRLSEMTDICDPYQDVQLPAREYDEAHRSSAMGGGSKLMGSGSRGVTGPGTNNSAAYSSPQSQADSVLIDRVDGVEIAFERAKTSSR